MRAFKPVGVYGAGNKNFLFPVETISRAIQRVQEILYLIRHEQDIPEEIEDYWDTIYSDGMIPYDINVSIVSSIGNDTFDSEYKFFATIYKCDYNEATGYWETDAATFYNLMKIDLVVVQGP